MERELEANLKFFSGQNSSSTTNAAAAAVGGGGPREQARLCAAALALVEEMKPLAGKVAEQAFLHDLPGVTGNGYWALLRVLDCCLSRLLSKVKNLSSERESVFFAARASTLMGAVKAYLDIFEILKHLFEATVDFGSEQAGKTTETRRAARASGAEEEKGNGSGGGDEGTLFFLDVGMEQVHERIDKLDLSVLYGDKFGYQYTYRLRHFLRAIVLTAASYSKSYSKHSDDHYVTQLASTYMHGLNFLMRPAKKGERVLEQYNQGDINFVKSFWNLTELPVATKFGAVVGASVEVCRVLNIPSSSPISMPKVGGGEVSIAMFPDKDEMKATCGPEYEAPTSIAARLISYRRLQGQEKEEDPEAAGRSPIAQMQQMHLPPGLSWARKTRPASPYLVVHFHGGGFIAQSSASHEVYLRDWAKGIDAPIISIDYGLAPEHPFPLAVEQSFYAYCWALKHAAELGSTAESVICVGDSAGGNLAGVVALRCLEERVRPPSGVVMLYPALFLHDTPSPSRMISLMDPLLPLGTLQMCMYTYASSFIEEHGPIMAALHQNPGMPLSGVAPATRRRMHHLSPLVAPDHLLAAFPPCVIMASELDPLLDDSVMLARRMRGLKRSADVKLKVVPLLPHGWLNMYFVGDRTSLNASNEVIVLIKQMLANGSAEARMARGEGRERATSPEPNLEESDEDAPVVKDDPSPPPGMWFPGEGFSTPNPDA